MQNNWLFVKICEWENPRLRFYSIFFIPTKTWKDYILLIGISQSIENISLLFFIVECIMLLLSSILSHFLQSQYLCYIRFTICSTFAFFNLSFSKKTTFLKEYSISAEDHPYFCAWHTEIIRLSFWRWWHKTVFDNNNIIFFITLLYLQLSFGSEIFKN